MRTSTASLLGIFAIDDQGEGHYTVRVRDDLGKEHDFAFAVVGTEIEVVQWDRDFDLFVEMNTGGSLKLFQLVLDFHHAREIRW